MAGRPTVSGSPSSSSSRAPATTATGQTNYGSGSPRAPRDTEHGSNGLGDTRLRGVRSTVIPKVLRAGTSGHAVPHARLPEPPSHVHSGTRSGGAPLSGTPALRLTLGKSAVIAPPHQGGGEAGLLAVATVLGLLALALALALRRRSQAAGAPAAAQLGWGPP
jgi:hypothetical protein